MGDFLPAAVFQDVGEKFGFASLLPLDGGFEFFEYAEIRSEEVAGELADDDVGFVEFLKDARFPEFADGEGVVGPWANQAVALHQFQVFAQLLDGLFIAVGIRSEERRVGKECRSRWSP